MFKLLAIYLLLNLYYNCICSLKSSDICFKKVECNYDKSSCSLSSCKGKLSYDCNRLECALNANLCDEYEQIMKYMDLKKMIKMDKLKALGPIRGVSFVTKNLRKLDKMKNNIKECSFY